MMVKRRLAAMISARFSPQQAELIAKAAQQRGVSQSQFIRDAALAAAAQLQPEPKRYPSAPQSDTLNCSLITDVKQWVVCR